ncbi:MAG: carbohydrate ABC transporter permease [Acidimicrobiales bacterium]
MRNALRYLLLVVAAAFVLFPIYAAFVVAIQPIGEFRDLGLLLPTNVTFSTFGDAWTDGHMGTYLRNSFVVTIAIVIGQVVTSILAGYAFAFLRFKGKRFLFLVVLSTLMVPTEVTIVGNLDTINKLHWIDTFAALIVPFLGWGFGVFLLRQAFLGIPGELRDAAAMDGYTHFGFMTRVAVPLVRPSIAALSLFSFLVAWNQYFWPLLVTNDDSRRTVQIGLKQLVSADAASFNRVMAGTLIAALPIALLLVVFERQLVRGITAGAVKG